MPVSCVHGGSIVQLKHGCCRLTMDRWVEVLAAQCTCLIG